MARIRTIKPEFWADDILGELPIEVHAFAAAILNHCDDEGYFNANPKMLGAQIFPVRDEYRNCTVHLQKLSEIDYIKLHKGSDGRVYGHVVNFLKHQVINKSKPSKIKGLILVQYEYGTSTVHVPLGTGNREQGKEHESILSLSEKKFENPPKSLKEYTPEFEEFWQQYPNNGASKKAAFQKYQSAIKKTDHQTIMAGVHAYAAHITGNEKFTAHATTWLHQERWTVDYAKQKDRTSTRPVEANEMSAANQGFIRAVGNCGDRHYPADGEIGEGSIHESYIQIPEEYNPSEGG